MPDLMHDLPPEPELERLAAALAKLRPVPAQAESPTFYYQAGRASRDTTVWRWKVGVAVLTLALVGTWIFATVRLRELHQQILMVSANTPEVVTPVNPLTPVEGLPLPPVVPRPMPAHSVPNTPPVVSVASVEADPTPEELADALRQRNQILVAGLTLLPRTSPPTGNENRVSLPGGVFTTPYHEPKKPAPVFPPDDE